MPIPVTRKRQEHPTAKGKPTKKAKLAVVESDDEDEEEEGSEGEEGEEGEEGDEGKEGDDEDDEDEDMDKGKGKPKKKTNAAKQAARMQKTMSNREENTSLTTKLMDCIDMSVLDTFHRPEFDDIRGFHPVRSLKSLFACDAKLLSRRLPASSARRGVASASSITPSSLTAASDVESKLCCARTNLFSPSQSTPARTLRSSPPQSKLPLRSSITTRR